MSGMRTGWATAALVAIHVLLCLALFEPKLHTGGDSVTYVLLAESILQTGDGYSLSLEPGPPEPHTKYPPAYPLMLAPLVALLGRSFVALKLVSLLCTAGSVALFCAYARGGAASEGGGGRPPHWLLLGLAFAVSPAVIDYSRWMLSEAPFLLFTLLALLMLREDERDAGAGRPFWLALAASVVAFYTRSIGALLLLATSVSYLLRRQWRKFLIHGGVGAGLTLPWLARSRSVTGTASGYFEEFLLESVYNPEAGRLGVGGMAARFLENAWLYASRELPRALTGSDSSWAANPLVKAAAVAACALVLWEVARRLRRGPGAAELYFVLTCAAIALFQSSVNDVRYLVPLVPLGIIYAAGGAAALARLVGRRLGASAGRRPAMARRAAATVVGALAALGLSAQAARVPGHAEMIARYSRDPYAGYAPAWRSFFEAAEWAADNTPEAAVFTVRKPRLFHALTNRKVRNYPFSTDPDSVLSVVRSTDYVVVDQVTGTTRAFLIPALLSDSTAFLGVYLDGTPPTAILENR